MHLARLQRRLGLLADAAYPRGRKCRNPVAEPGISASKPRRRNIVHEPERQRQESREHGTGRGGGEVIRADSGRGVKNHGSACPAGARE